jgi:hypothetical protein
MFSLNAMLLLFRFGMEVPFQGDAERADMFKKMDENGDGSISFDEWLSFSLAEIISKVACPCIRT